MPSKNDEASRARQKVYYSARQRLIENHADEYRTLLNEEADKAGVTLSIRKTPEEKAEEQLAALLEQFPHLQAKVEPLDGEDSDSA